MNGRLNSVSVRNLLPRVFEREQLPYSDLWRNSFCFRRGECYLVEAASGGGKSSLAAFLMGIRSDYLGEIFFDDTDIRSLSIARWQEIRRAHMAYLPQELALFPQLSAIDNIMLKAEVSDFTDLKRIDEWMERLGIESRRDYKAAHLSIGQQQRVALIRSLCQPFDFILLDEPVSHLDEVNNRVAARIVEEEAARRDAAVVVFSVGNPLLLSNPVKINL